MQIDEKTADIDKLEIFFYLCQMQSFSLAAKTLGVSQSMVSKSIRELEKNLQVKLIENSQKPIILTPLGKKLHDICKDFNFEVVNLKENLVSSKNFLEKSDYIFNISIPMLLGCLIARIIKKIITTYPEISININYTNEINTNQLNKKDFFIITQPFESVLATNELIGSYEMKFAASYDYIKKFGYPKYFKDLPKHDFIYITDYPYEKFTSEKIYSQLSKKYLIDNELCGMKALDYGAGIGISPKFVGKDFKNLTFFDVEEKMKNINVYMVYSNIKKNHYLFILTDLFKMYLREIINDTHNESYYVTRG